MDNFQKIDPYKLSDNIFHLLDKEWMLITAGHADSFNTMTASWGSFGVLWKKPVATIFIRPQRHTLSFVETSDMFSLSFLYPEHKNIYSYCGKYSGKDVDKVKETGLKPIVMPSGTITFEQARLVMECKKLYTADLKKERFNIPQIAEEIYPEGDFHRMFIGEITNCYSKI